MFITVGGNFRVTLTGTNTTQYCRLFQVSIWSCWDSQESPSASPTGSPSASAPGLPFARLYLWIAASMNLNPWPRVEGNWIPVALVWFLPNCVIVMSVMMWKRTLLLPVWSRCHGLNLYNAFTFVNGATHEFRLASTLTALPEFVFNVDTTICSSGMMWLHGTGYCCYR